MATDEGASSSPAATRVASHDGTPTATVDMARATTSGEGVRPNFSKQWQTERPRAVFRTSTLDHPTLNRRTTGASALNHAIWSHPNNEDDTTTSDSSADEEEEAEAHKRHFRHHGRHQLKKGKGSYSRFNVGNEDFKTRGRVRSDGRLNISVNETNNKGYLAKALGASFLKHLAPDVSDDTGGLSPHVTREEIEGKFSRTSSEATITCDIPRPTLNIVVMVIGSRGDIQPFLKLGKNLKEFGHRVRIATHPAFKDFVQKDSGLEFFSVGGDPAELMAFMVKNPGMIPTMDTLKKGEVGRRRDQMAEMFEGFWRACINATDDEKDVSNLKMMGEKSPFVADAIIANPPSFAHIHCAERLGIPLHLMFTFPYTPTQAFPHPLANIKKTNVDPGYANFMSYPLVEMMTWQGLGDLVNNFRVKTLGLEPVSTLWAPGQLYRLKVPYTYLWSPGLVPKPKDWGPEIDIAGFVFLDLASSFDPPKELTEFLDAGEPPVYIGFGSIVVDDPDKFTEMIFEAVEKAGVRALVSKGWGGLGGDNTPDNVFMLENTPHDWLFPKVKAVVHHGGAGTTAIGLKCGKPTMIVPFFGDQQFWGSMIGEAGAGAAPIPYKELTADKLAKGIKQCLTEKAEKAARKIAKDIEAEGDGAKNAVISFHRSLVLRGQNSMRCSILEDRVAVWTLKNTNLRLSALAAELLVEKRKITWKQLRLIRHNEWNDFEGPGEPLSGGATAILGTVTGIATGVGSVPFRIAKSTKRKAKRDARRKKSEEVGRKNQDQRKSMESARQRRSNDNADGKESMVNGHPPNGINGAAKYGFTNGPAGGDAGMTAQKESEKPIGSEQKAQAGHNSPHQAPAETEPESPSLASPTMGQHTTSGEPMSQKRHAQREDHAMQEDDYESESDIDEKDLEMNTAEEYGKDVGHGVGKSAKAMVSAPMDLTLAIAQGFHNAPRLYGDTTVRRPTRITGMKSGLKAAGEEFVFGVYDGVTGLIAQPYTGARDNGPIGFVKGVGMGLTGFVLKDLAAIFGPFGYTFKGIHKELLKSKQPTKFIRKARILEGQKDLHSLDEKALKKASETVAHGWSVVLQIWKLMEEKKKDGGLVGRWHVMRQRKQWRLNGAFENVEAAEKALEAQKKGESLEGIFKGQKEELDMVEKPRNGVVGDLEKGQRSSGERQQVVQKKEEDGKPTREMPKVAV